MLPFSPQVALVTYGPLRSPNRTDSFQSRWPAVGPPSDDVESDPALISKGVWPELLPAWHAFLLIFLHFTNINIFSVLVQHILKMPSIKCLKISDTFYLYNVKWIFQDSTTDNLGEEDEMGREQLVLLHSTGSRNSIFWLVWLDRPFL